MASEQFVVFQLAKEEYAISIGQVKEIICYNGATKLPNALGYIDGIINLPKAVLLKPGKLTEVEFEIVKTHTVFGAQTLEAVFQFYPNELLEMALAIARSHHEMWDGSGYPDGLSGESIPLCARIMGLANVYDAIRSQRCYKNAMSHEMAYKYIRENSGKHFDPQLVEVFLQVKEEFLTIYNDVKM